MSALGSVNVRALFVDLGIELENVGSDLVIDRFEHFSIDGSRGAVRGCGGACICRADMLDAA
ncbi:hypothetical protein SAMN05421837_106751 [Amycolatopsis pretoriensis]|uniref:Uncharacterized protein n=1 Tax=Amycolatopsis pretoriensis TaxID=218821 RepID=A0A1H5R768_9PSEU|nr:hypothetical protein [Amycolatopsis pretoriensis]SEF33368.1 hypothetical protein SAMN05421837_106751 [Amycolatopsis pretoriensis]